MGKPPAKVKRGFGEVGQLPSGRFRARYTGPTAAGTVLRSPSSPKSTPRGGWSTRNG